MRCKGITVRGMRCELQGVVFGYCPAHFDQYGEGRAKRKERMKGKKVKKHE